MHFTLFSFLYHPLWAAIEIETPYQEKQNKTNNKIYFPSCLENFYPL